jgi:hypothetical protein
MRTIKYLFLFSIIALLLSNCAVNGTIGGGPKDIKAPSLIPEQSAKHGQTNFRPKELEFFFDEYIEIKDISKQVFISPSTKYFPKIKAKGKKVILEFSEQEVLKDSTTYTINFGEAIRDFNENNKLLNFTYVFSTGDKIDSLELSGMVTDASTGKAAEGMTILLYDNLTDSVLVKEKPFYSTKTTKEGKYKITNIKKDTFKIVVIKDANNSYTWNESNEEIGFIDSLILWQDSFVSLVKNMNISKPDYASRIFNVNGDQAGLVKIKLNQNTSDVPQTVASDGRTLFTNVVGDSLFIRYKPIFDSFSIFTLNDTIKIKPKKQGSYFDTLIVQPLFDLLATNPYDSLAFLLSSPCDHVSTQNILLKDSIHESIPFEASLSNHGRTLILKAKLPQKNKLSIAFLHDALIDIYGNKNKVEEKKFNTITDEAMGTIKLNITQLDSNYAYICRFSIGTESLQEIYFDKKTNYLWSIEHLKPEKYTISIVEDRNFNKKRDAILYWQKQQAEPSHKVELEKLRENWTMETELNWKKLSGK